MKSFFEVMADEVLPAVRALIAKKLIENGFSQKQVAEKLGLTQPAISQYKRNIRGYRKDILENNPKLLEMADALVKRVASGEISPQEANMELFEICREMFREV